MNYSYEKVGAYAKSIGVKWKEKWIEDFDQMAKAHGFSQSQVDISTQLAVRKIAPGAYGFFKRLALGLKFIAGKI